MPYDTEIMRRLRGDRRRIRRNVLFIKPSPNACFVEFHSKLYFLVTNIPNVMKLNSYTSARVTKYCSHKLSRLAQIKSTRRQCGHGRVARIENAQKMHRR